MVITQKTVQKLEPANERVQYMDDDTTGFGVRVDPDGRRSYFWKSKVHGVTRFRACGEYPLTTVKNAKAKAQEWASIAAKWRAAGYPDPDPFNKVKAEPRAKVPTFRELSEAYIERHIHNPDPEKAANNPKRAEDQLRRVLKRYFEDWMDRPIDKITVKDAVTLKENILKVAARSNYARSGGRYQANRTMEYVRAMYGWSGTSANGKINFWPVADNPAKDVEACSEESRDRFLKPEELLRFNQELEKEPSRDLRDFLTIALSTGARSENILSAEWKDVSLDLRNWHIPLSKSGKSYDVDLTDAPLRVLERRRAEVPEAERFVFPAHSESGHRVSVKREWQAFRKRAELEDFRVHDLRRSHGSYMALSGVSLQKIGAALGHTSLDSTKIYARLQQQAITEARMAGEKKMRELMLQAKKRLAKEKREKTPHKLLLGAG